MIVPKTITHRTRNGEQTYELVAVETYARADGNKSKFAVWRTSCRICGTPFYATSATSSRGINRGMTVHCPSHRKGGGERATAYHASLESRYGTAS
jgi:hypothetical protein